MQLHNFFLIPALLFYVLSFDIVEERLVGFKTASHPSSG